MIIRRRLMFMAAVTAVITSITFYAMNAVI